VNRPLHDLHVVELGGGIAASVATMLLAEHGAEVVRVGSGTADPVLDAILGRGKIDIDIDIDDPAWRELLDHADVVVAAPEAPEIDFDALRERNPGLISCRVAAFPTQDPRAALPPHEAAAGMAGFLFNKPIGKPFFHDFAVGSVTSGLYAAIGTAAALVARERIGCGQHVDTSYYEAALSSQVLQILAKTGIPRAFMPLRMIGSPFMRVWQCGDDRYVYLHITMPKHNVRMLEILEANDYQREVAEIRAIMSPQTMRDPSQVKSISEAKKLKAIYTRIFRSQPAIAWEELLGHDLCCIKVRTVEEWLPDSIEAGMSDACRIDDPVLGDLLVPGPLVDRPESPARVEPRHLTNLDAVLKEWQQRPRAEWHALREVELTHPLAGTRVVDLSRIIAGPCAARVLAELGAEVVSIQSETRLDWALSFHLIFNAGKRSVTLDFTDDAGKDKLWAILDDVQPDVLIHNYRHLELAEEIGVGPAQVRARFPGITYTHLNAYGNHGVWKDRPGFEQVVQAVSGIQVAYARGARPKLLPSPIIDIGCGLLGAFASVVGLYNARRTGTGTVATTHLTTMAVLLQLPRVAEIQRALAPRDTDRQVVAGIASARGRPVCVTGPRRDIHRWLEHAGIACHDDDVVAALADGLRWHSVSHWQRSLNDAGLGDRVALVPNPRIGRAVEEIAELDPRPAAIVRRRNFPGAPHPLTFVGCPLRLSSTPLADIGPPPLRGTHTRDVLGRVGVDVPRDTGLIAYPPEKPFLLWLLSFIRWGYFAWKSGNI